MVRQILDMYPGLAQSPTVYSRLTSNSKSSCLGFPKPMTHTFILSTQESQEDRSL